MTIVNGSFNLHEEKEQCDYFCWIDPEWDERSCAVMLKLMKKKAKAEEDAKQWEGELGKPNYELREIMNELKIARQKLQKATAELKTIGNYKHNVKLTDVLLALFVVFARMAGLMLCGKANYMSRSCILQVSLWYLLTVLTTEIRLSEPRVREEYMISFMHIFSTNKVPRVVL
jgi:hypothetical protein